MNLLKLINVALVATTLGATATIATPNVDLTAQAKAKVITVTETESSDGTHYYTIDGKYYTPEAYAAWNKARLAKAYGYLTSKLTAKKTKTGKSVNVTGKVKVGNAKLAKAHKATYVRIKSYRGYKYAKLTKKLTFQKTIKAPKAKKITAQAGYYSTKKKHGKSVKTFHVWGATKQATVKAYK